MAGFTKLVPEIIQSSIWNESSDIRVVWITMLATKDENGYVRGDAKTIARLANVSVESAKEALEIFQQPDPSSHTPDNDGRRISPMPGGWLVLNADKYRLHDDVIREKTRERVRRFRSKQADVTPCNVTCALPSASVSVSVSPEGVQGEAKEPTPEDIYQLYPLKVGKPQALRAIAKAIAKHGAAHVLERTQRYAAIRNGDREFMPHPATWFNQERYNDDESTWQRASTNAAKPNDRNAGTYNEGRASEYANAAK